MTPLLSDLQAHWTPLAPIFSLRDENEYEAAVVRLNALVDEVGTNEKHPLYGLLDTLGSVIHAYEEQHHTIAKPTGTEALKFLMQEHELTATDLTELGSTTEVELVLTGKRELSMEQVRALAARFHVSPAVFV
jgi:HTH-type transcriptional regulator/antitoxin HigA